MRSRTILACAAVLLVCAPSCSSDSCKTVRDCDATQRCVDFVCRNSGDNPGALGDSCASNAQCGSGLTCSMPSDGFPNGYCTASCTSAGCAVGSCAGVASGAICAPACTGDTSCRTGYSCCAALGNVCVPSGACLPASCGRPVVTSALPSTQVIALGKHQVGDQVPFDVPAGTGSIAIIEQAVTANLEVLIQNHVLENNAVPLTITRPDGVVAYDDTSTAFSAPSSSDGGQDPSGIYAMYGNSSPSTAQFVIPNTAKALADGVPAGTWKFVVNDFAYECSPSGSGCQDGGVANNVYDVSVLLKPLPGASGNIDLALYIVADVNGTTGQPFTAASAQTDASAQRMVRTYTNLFAAAGITVRSVHWYDVSEADKTRFGTNIDADATGPCDELDQMFTLSGANPGNTINLFLVQSITSKNQGGGSVVGIDGTIPGPATLTGTVHSGAAVSLADLFTQFRTGACGSSGVNLACGADEVAYIAAHETGHFLGLYHTTELSGDLFDPLTDTDKCPCLPCAASADRPRCDTQTGSNPVFLEASLCKTGPTCGGGANLMFWQLDAAVSLGTISSQQAQIMLRNPAVQ